MTINRLYRTREQEWIMADIQIARARQAGTASKAIRYFKEKAETYNLFTRVYNQIRAYNAKIINVENLTTNEEIAELFGVYRSSVSRYFDEKALTLGVDKDFKDRISILRSAGGAKGGANSSTKGYQQKRTWSRKKK
jgi:predicted transcriptional regulator